MMEQSLKKNPFLNEIESLLSDLGLDTIQAKQVFPTGVQFYFSYNDVPLYLSLPDQVPSTYSNISRIEAEIAELEETNASRLIYTVSIYLNTNDCTPVRVVAKRSKGQRVKVLLQFVSDLESLQPGSLTSILIHCCELADELRREMVLHSKSKTA